jgi:hypothetical protein
LEPVAASKNAFLEATHFGGQYRGGCILTRLCGKKPSIFENRFCSSVITSSIGIVAGKPYSMKHHSSINPSAIRFLRIVVIIFFAENHLSTNAMAIGRTSMFFRSQ